MCCAENNVCTHTQRIESSTARQVVQYSGVLKSEQILPGTMGT